MWTLPRVAFSASTPGGVARVSRHAHTLRRSTFTALYLRGFFKATFSDNVLGTGSFAPDHNRKVIECVRHLWLFEPWRLAATIFSTTRENATLHQKARLAYKC